MTFTTNEASKGKHPWYEEAIFYHIYPLGLTGAPTENAYGKPEHRLLELLPWVSHIAKLGFTGLYIGPLFESVGHGYETTDYRKLDSRLGTNEDLKQFVSACHEQGIRVILDGVFNHTGRDFFAFQDIKANRENSRYKDWYCNVNFGGNNSYGDGFSYENWGGYDLLVKLNQRNPEVRDYICDVMEFWVSEFDIDGIRLDAADVLDFEFMKALRQKADMLKPDFWLMGEVIHGDYTRWVNQQTLHSVTNYQLHKALYSGHNDHNYFEIAHTVKYLQEKFAGRLQDFHLYNFVDNHDVERIYTKLTDKAHMTPVHILLYTLPGVPSVYYGSEFGIAGKKERYSDVSLRPALSLKDFEEALNGHGQMGQLVRLIARLGEVRKSVKALSFGDFKELMLTNRQYAFCRDYMGESVIVAVNNDAGSVGVRLPVPSKRVPSEGNSIAQYEGTSLSAEQESFHGMRYVGVLSGKMVDVHDDHIEVELPGNGGEIWVPCNVESWVSETKTATVEAWSQTVPETPLVEEANAGETTAEIAAEEVAALQEPVSELHDEKSLAYEFVAGEFEEENSSAESSTAEDDIPWHKSYEEMTVEELQRVIYAKMKANGPVTERMYQDIVENVYHDSLVNWAKSFR